MTPTPFRGDYHAGHRVRSERARFKEQLATGSIDAIAALMDPPWFIESMRVLEFLEALPWLGASRLRRFNVRAAMQMPPVNLLAEVKDLGPHQRRWLVEQLPALTAGRCDGQPVAAAA